jgi:iron complex transport system substrate-binding protein
MTERIASVLLAVLGVAWSVLAGAAVTLTDDRGRTVSLERPAARIVTLAPHLVELAYAAGAGDRLVGVSARSDYPEEARSLPVISDAGRMDLERIVALNPDLVLAWMSGNPSRQVEQLERRGIPVLATEARRLGDIARLLRLIGLAAGSRAQGEQAARRYEEEVHDLQARYMGQQPLRVFVELWHEPLITASGAHLISDVVRLCGGVNVFESAAMLTPTVSMESVLFARPQAVIMTSGAGTPAEQAGRWQRFALLPAVRRGALYALDPSLLERQGPRVVAAARSVCEGLAQARAARGKSG